jgi:hypothetical protein
MNTKQTIMIQISDHEWTLEALHYACLLARNTSATIALVQMIPVQHLSWLGTDFGYINVTPDEQSNFAEYQVAIEDYGVEFTPLLFQYDSLAEAIAQAAEHVDAQIVFAKLPEGVFPLATRLERWMLGRQLARQQRQWIQRPTYHTETPKNTIETASETNDLAAHPVH